MKVHYQRTLPHLLPPGATIFFTFRLAGTMPTAVIQQLATEQELALQEATKAAAGNHQEVLAKIKKKQFAKFDALLDQAAHGVSWLNKPIIAELVAAEINLLVEVQAVVLAYCLMPNHVHLLVQLPEDVSFSAADMMQRLKGRTALAANKILQLQGQSFWQKESYDHLVRDARERERIVAYILNNPVKAGLVDDWTKWPYSYYAG